MNNLIWDATSDKGENIEASIGKAIEAGCDRIIHNGVLYDLSKGVTADRQGYVKIQNLMDLSPVALTNGLTFQKAISIARDCAMYCGRGSDQFPGCEAVINSLEREAQRNGMRTVGAVIREAIEGTSG